MLGNSISKIVSKLSFALLLFCMSSLAVAANKVLNIQHWQTKNGTRVYFVASRQVPMVDVRLAFAAGSSRDANQPGVAALSNDMLDQGAAGMDATAIAKQFAQVGAIFSTAAARDSAVLSLRSLSKPQALNAAVDTFVKVLTQPTFPETAFAREQKNQLQSLKAQQQSPSAIASKAFYQAVYKQSPYAHPVIGNEKSVQALTPKALRDFYAKYYVAKNAVMAIVGDLSVSQAKQLAEKITENLPAGKRAASIAKAPALTKSVEQVIKYPSTQTNVRIGQVGISRHSEDFYPLLVGNHILGGAPLVSRLNEQVREKRGLSYAIYSMFVPMQEAGPFVISFATKSSQAEQALQITRKTLQRFVQQGPTDKELAFAKKNLTGRFPLQFDSNSKIASALLNIGIYNLPIDYYDQYVAKVQSVTTEQIRQAFSKHINPQTMVTILVGTAAKQTSSS